MSKGDSEIRFFSLRAVHFHIINVVSEEIRDIIAVEERDNDFRANLLMHVTEIGVFKQALSSQH